MYGDLSDNSLSGQIRRCKFSLRIKIILPLIFYPVKPFACLGEPIEERSLIPVTAIGYLNLRITYNFKQTPWGQHWLQCRIFCRGELKSRHTVIREPCCNSMLEACPRCSDIFAATMRLSDRVSQGCDYNYGTFSVIVAQQECYAYTFCYIAFLYYSNYLIYLFLPIS